MIPVNRLREFLLECKNSITSINFTQLVVDDSELVKFLNDKEDTDNTFLIAVMPQFNVIGNEDRAKWDNQLMFLILDKSTDKNFEDYDAYLDMFADTQAVTSEFVELLLGQKVGDNGEFCGLMNELKEDSIVVTPVWRKAQCNGWQVQIDLVTRF